MRVVAPMPVTDAPVTSTAGRFSWSLAWRKFLQQLGDFARAATLARTTAQGARYVQTGAVVVLSYQGHGGIELELPNLSAGPAWLDVWDGTTWTRVEAIPQANGTQTATLPAGDPIQARGVYLATMTE